MEISISQHFTFTPEQLKKAYKALIKNGIKDRAIQDERITQAQETGKVSIFAYGSLLHTAHTDQTIISTKAHVKGMSARFTQAFTYYGGEAGRSTLMLALEKDKNGVTYGAIQEVGIASAKDFIKFYDDLQIRENPVNNPIYSFNDTIEVETAQGQKVRCITCLSNTDGPLHLVHKGLSEKERLTLDEEALILAHAVGPDQRLNNAIFRKTKGTTKKNVQFVSLQAHQKTGAAYLYHYLATYREWGFPPNDYLEQLLDKVNTYRRDMYPLGRNFLEESENKGDRTYGLIPRQKNVSHIFAKHSQADVFNKYVLANDKLNNIMMKNPNYKNWKREWSAPNPYQAMEHAA